MLLPLTTETPRHISLIAKTPVIYCINYFFGAFNQSVVKIEEKIKMIQPIAFEKSAKIFPTVLFYQIFLASLDLHNISREK